MATALFLRWIFHRYPKDFTSSFQQFTSIPLADCSRYPDICTELVKAHQSSVRRFCNAWLLSRSSQDITVALQWMSGLADAELETIENWAREHQQNITDQLLWSIKERFSHHPRLTSVLERLEKLIAAAPPSDIDPAWSVEQWLNWVTEEYLPYFAWVIRNESTTQGTN